MEKIKEFFGSFCSIFKFLRTLATDEKLSRLRILIIWSLSSFILSFVIYNTIQKWQVFIPAIELIGNHKPQQNSLFNMIIGTSVISILFFITDGIRGYHKMFNELIELPFKAFTRKSVSELVEEFGNEGIEKLKKVNFFKKIAGFIVLELILILWSIFTYFFVGGIPSGLGLLGYMADDLLLGIYLFFLEGFYSIYDGLSVVSQVYKPISLFGSQNEE